MYLVELILPKADTLRTRKSDHLREVSAYGREKKNVMFVGEWDNYYMSTYGRCPPTGGARLYYPPFAFSEMHDVWFW